MLLQPTAHRQPGALWGGAGSTAGRGPASPGGGTQSLDLWVRLDVKILRAAH